MNERPRTGIGSIAFLAVAGLLHSAMGHAVIDTSGLRPEGRRKKHGGAFGGRGKMKCRRKTLHGARLGPFDPRPCTGGRWTKWKDEHYPNSGRSDELKLWSNKDSDPVGDIVAAMGIARS